MKKLVITMLLSSCVANVQAWSGVDVFGAITCLGAAKGGQLLTNHVISLKGSSREIVTGVVAGGALLYAAAQPSVVTGALGISDTDTSYQTKAIRVVANGTATAALVAVGQQFVGSSLFQADSWYLNKDTVIPAAAALAGIYLFAKGIQYARAPKKVA